MHKILFLSFLTFFLSCCASGSAVVTGIARSPIDPTFVKIVGEYPKDYDYEVIGIVTATSDAGWDANGDIEYAKEELKKQAAKIGANTVVIEGLNRSTDYIYTNSMVLPATSHTLSGRALYVSIFPKKVPQTTYSRKPTQSEQPQKKESFLESIGYKSLNKPPKSKKNVHVAIVETYSNGVIKSNEGQYLTDVLREEAVSILPSDQNYVIMTRENIKSMLPPNTKIEECEGSCLVETGRNIAADYIAQARVNTFGSKLTITVELYSSTSGKLISSFNAKSSDIESLESEIRQKSPAIFKEVLRIESAN